MISTRAIVLAFTLSVSPMAMAIATAQTAPVAAVETRTVGQLVMQNVPVTPEAIRERFQHDLAAVIDAGACALAPTTVIDLTPMGTGGDPEVIRVGQGPLDALGLGQ
mgnify:CR=1 FL=1